MDEQHAMHSAAVTTVDVARLAGVSQATVSRYLNGQHIRTAERVQNAIDELRFRPSHAGRALKSGRSQAIAILGADAANPFFSLALKGAAEAASEHKYAVMLYGFLAGRENDIIADLRGRVDGVILTPRDEFDPLAQALWDADIPFVFMNGVVRDGPPADSVLMDNEAGTRAAVDHLADLGHLQIAAIHGRPDSTIGRERREAFEQVIAERGLSVPVRFSQPGEYGREYGRTAMAKLLADPERPTAVFISGSLPAVGALSALRAANVSLPGDLSVVVFDDFELFDQLTPPLTVVSRPDVEMGAAAVNMLVSRLTSGSKAGQRRLRLPISLLQRGSTSGPHALTPD